MRKSAKSLGRAAVIVTCLAVGAGSLAGCASSPSAESAPATSASVSGAPEVIEKEAGLFRGPIYLRVYNQFGDDPASVQICGVDNCKPWTTLSKGQSIDVIGKSVHGAIKDLTTGFMIIFWAENPDFTLPYITTKPAYGMTACGGPHEAELRENTAVTVGVCVSDPNYTGPEQAWKSFILSRGVDSSQVNMMITWNNDYRSEPWQQG